MLALCGASQPHLPCWDPYGVQAPTPEPRTHRHLNTTPQVQTGAGRTGTWWGHQHWLPTAPASNSSTTGTAAGSTAADACPDLMVFAKGIASGYPLAGVAVRSSLVPADKMPPGTLVGADRYFPMYRNPLPGVFEL